MIPAGDPRPVTAPTILRPMDSRSTSAASPATLDDWIVFGLLGLFWGSSYLFIKIGVETLPTFTLIAGRLATGSLLLGLVVLARGVQLPRDPAVYRHLVVLGIANVALPFTLITTSERTIDSGLAAIINGAVPLFTIVFAALVLQDEPITVNRLVGLVVGFAGVVVLTGGSLAAVGGSDLGGELTMVASTIAYAAGNVYARRNVRGLSPIVPAFFQVFIAFLVTATLAIVIDRPWTVDYRGEAVFAMVWLGVFGSGLAYLCYYRLLGRWGSTRTSLSAYVLPIVGIALGHLFLGEVVDLRIVVGTALIIGGVGLVNARYGRRRLFGRGPATAAGAAAGSAAAAEAAAVTAVAGVAEASPPDTDER